MPFNSLKSGYQNEDEFVKLLNNKKVCDIPYDLQLFIYDLFKYISYNNTIKCFKDYTKRKYDIVIIINNYIRRISIKKGIKCSVHNEPISEMIHFLIENKMPKEMIINFLKYHYADGTTNGTGSNRITANEYKKKNQKEIDKINEFINKKSFLYKAIDRFVIKGRNSKYKIDAILYGVPNDFLWIKRKNIYQILLQNINNYSTAIHFGRLTYQPLSRCINYNSKYEKSRHISQIKWYNISDDIIECMNMNVYPS